MLRTQLRDHFVSIKVCQIDVICNPFCTKMCEKLCIRWPKKFWFVPKGNIMALGIAKIKQKTGSHGSSGNDDNNQHFAAIIQVNLR